MRANICCKLALVVSLLTGPFSARIEKKAQCHTPTIDPSLTDQLADQEPKTEPRFKELPESLLNAELKSARRGRFKLSSYKGNVVVLSLQDVSISLMQGNTAIPQLLLIRDGKIVKRFIGFNPDQTPSMMKQAIEEALKQD